MSLRTAFRNWLLAEPATHDGPCKCGEHNQGGLPRQSSTETPPGPDFTKPGLRFEDRRMVKDQRWLMTVIDGPTNYLLAAFIGDTYAEVLAEAEAFHHEWQREMKMRAHGSNG